jgi:glycosyltransferase involved in cell wall biosynthesis
MLYVASKIFGTNVYHDVIGGNLDVYVKNNPSFCKYLNAFKVNWVETNSMKAKLEAVGLKNAEVLPNFKKLESIPASPYEEEMFRFCTFSRVMKEKGIETAIQAVKKINSEYGKPMCSLTIYGAVDAGYVDAFEKLEWLHLQNPGTHVGEGGEFFDEFMAGNQLFVRAFISSGQTFRNMTDDYGVLPLPKYDEEQEEYRTLAANISSLVVVLSSATELDKIGATLELMAAESYKQVIPAYYDTVLKGKYSDAPQDAAMYDLIINSLTYNFGFCFSTHSLEGIGSLFRVLDIDIAQKYAANKIKYETGLEDLVNKLDELAWRMSMGE